MYQALQVHKETNSGEGGAGHGPLCKEAYGTIMLCVCVHQRGETGICDIPTYWDDWTGKKIKF